MIVARQVFHAKYARGAELIALFQEFNALMRAEGVGKPQFRILTDASGPFFTVVTEIEVESLAAWDTSFRESMSVPWIGEWFGKTVPLVDSGSREFFTLVD